MLKRRSNQR